MDYIDENGLSNHKFIVFSQDHYNPLNLIRSLGEKGIKPISIVYGSHKWMIPYCRYIGTIHNVKTLEEGYRILIEKYGDEDYKPFVLCSDDLTTSYLDRHYEELIAKFYFYNAGEHERLIWLQNKDNITTLASQVGILSPKKEVVETGVLPQTLSYPIMTKTLSSTMGAWKGDVYVCYNKKELEKAYNKIKSPKLILQEFIKKKGEFCIEGFSVNDGTDVYIPYRIDYIRYYIDSYGHYMTVKVFEDDELRKKIVELMKLTRFNGIFELEFMLGPNDEVFFLEINFRSSTWAFALTVGGCNMPYLWAKSTLLGRIPYKEICIEKESFTAMQEPDDFSLSVIKYKMVKLSQWLKEVRRCKCHYFYNKKDKSPFFHYIFFRVKKHIENSIGITLKV